MPPVLHSAIRHSTQCKFDDFTRHLAESRLGSRVFHFPKNFQTPIRRKRKVFPRHGRLAGCVGLAGHMGRPAVRSAMISGRQKVDSADKPNVAWRSLCRHPECCMGLCVASRPMLHGPIWVGKMNGRKSPLDIQRNENLTVFRAIWPKVGLPHGFSISPKTFRHPFAEKEKPPHRMVGRRVVAVLPPSWVDSRIGRPSCGSPRADQPTTKAAFLICSDDSQIVDKASPRMAFPRNVACRLIRHPDSGNGPDKPSHGPPDSGRSCPVG